MGYHRAGFHVTGIDINLQPRYPFEFIQADALDYLREHGHEYDAIHASPPCQAYSTKTRDRSKHPRLIEPLRELLIKFERPWIIENVAGAPLIAPVQLCGSCFNLRVRRHRFFESSFPIAGQACRHDWQDADKRFRLYDHGKWFDSGIVHVFGSGGGKGAEHWPEAMGIDWMVRDELREAIPPAYTEFIGEQLIREVTP